MDVKIPVHDKLHFMKWFLTNYHLKRQEGVWILKYILKRVEVLTNIHFVRDVKYCPRGIMISSECSSEVDFHFYKEHLVTSDPDKAFHDIRLNPYEPLYIQLNFNHVEQNSNYAGVLEENPFVPLNKKRQQKDEVNASRVLTHMLYLSKKKELLKAIDHALDISNRKYFKELTDELIELEKNKFN